MKEESELSRSVRRAIDVYFRDLDGQKPHEQNQRYQNGCQLGICQRKP